VANVQGVLSGGCGWDVVVFLFVSVELKAGDEGSQCWLGLFRSACFRGVLFVAVLLLCVSGVGAGFGPGVGVVFGQGGCDPSLQSCQPDGQVSVDPGAGQVQSGGQGSPAVPVSVDPGGQGSTSQAGASQPAVNMTSISPPPCDVGSSCTGQLQSPSPKSVADATVLDPSVGFLSTWLGGVEQGVLPTPVDTPGSYFAAYGQLGGIFRGCVDAGLNVSYGGVTSCDSSGTTCVLQCPQGTTAFNADVAGANTCTDTTLLVPVNKWASSTQDPYICPPSYSYYPGRPQGGPGNLFPAIPELCYRNCDGNQSLIAPVFLAHLDVAPLLTTPMLVNSDTAATNTQVADIADKTVHPIRTMIDALAQHGIDTGQDPDRMQTFRLYATAATSTMLLLSSIPETPLNTPPNGLTGLTPTLATAETTTPAAIETITPTTTSRSLPATIIAMSNKGDGNGGDKGPSNTSSAPTSQTQSLPEVLDEVGYGVQKPNPTVAELRQAANQAIADYKEKAATAQAEAVLARPTNAKRSVALHEQSVTDISGWQGTPRQDIIDGYREGMDDLSTTMDENNLDPSKIKIIKGRLYFPDLPSGEDFHFWHISTGEFKFDSEINQYYANMISDQNAAEYWLKAERVRYALGKHTTLRRIP